MVAFLIRAGLQQLDCGEFEVLAVALTLTFCIDLLFLFSHLTPPVVLSTIKNVREMRVSSDSIDQTLHRNSHCKSIESDPIDSLLVM